MNDNLTRSLCIKTTSLVFGAAVTMAIACDSASAAQCEMISTLNDPPTADQAELGNSARRALVVTLGDGIFQPGQADFSLGRTLGQIITTAGSEDTSAERISMLQSIIRSFNVSRQENPDSGLEIEVQANRPEAMLDPAQLLDANAGDAMQPVGLFNRFDLADANFETCGEHRIVYALDDPALPTEPPDLRRLTFIFEAALPNPAPILGQAGCLPVVNFWKGLETIEDPDELASRLEEFYYSGLDFDGDNSPDLAPVVHFDHYGTKGGQFRTNNFITDGNPIGNPWQLREWLVGRNLDGSPTFTVETVKDSPLAEFYRVAASGEHPDKSAARTGFRNELLSRNLFNLVGPDLDAAATSQTLDPHELTSQIAAQFDNGFNDFENVSQGSADDPANNTEASFETAIQSRLDTFTNLGLTADHLINRAGAVTCGGCHDFSNNVEIAPGGISWPPSLRFVHIDEQGALSDALIDHFLRFRCEALDEAAGGTILSAEPRTAANIAALHIQQVANVEAAEQNFMAADTPEQKAESLGRLKEAVRLDRIRRENAPGAFYTVRRTH